jgi:hypothetical protein
MAMNVTELLSAIDSEIFRLQQVRAILADSSVHASAKRGRPVGNKRTMSVEGRARIAEAQRKRWAKQEKVK